MSNTDGAQGHVHDNRGKKKSRGFPVLAVGLLVAMAVAVAGGLWWMQGDGDGGGDEVAYVGSDAASGSGTVLPEGVQGEEQVLGATVDETAPEPEEEDFDSQPLPDYESVVIRGRLVVEDGGKLPPELSVHAAYRAPSPHLRTISVGDDEPRFERIEDVSDERLRHVTRAHPDSEGRFELPNVPSSGAWLVVEDSHLYPSEPVLLDDFPADSDVLLTRGARVVGTITDADGKALPDASVSARSAIDAFFMFETSPRMVSIDTVQTDANGTYALDQVPVNVSLNTTIIQGEHEIALEEIPPLASGAEYTLDIQMRVGAMLSGMVVDVDGKPVSDARVMIQSASLSMTSLDVMGRMPEVPARTDEQGRFHFDALAPGGYRLSLAAAGYRVYKSEVIDLAASEVRDDVQLLAETGLGVAGRVVDPDGQPIDDARVVVALPPSMINMQANLDRQLRERVRTDGEGGFSVSGYDEGPVRIWARKTGYVSASIDVEAGAEEAVITLTPTMGLSGIAITLGDAEPLEAYSLSITPEEGLFDLTNMMEMDQKIGNLAPPIRVRDENGEFHMDGVAPGVYDLTLTAEGYAKTVVKGVDVKPRKGASGIVILVPEEARIVGRVVSKQTGEPLVNALVTTGKTDIMSMVSEKMTGAVIESKTDAGGHFELTGLGSEALTLTVRHDEHQELGLEAIALREGEVRDLGVLVLSSGARLYGQLRDVEGAPEAGVDVFASTATGSFFRKASTDPDGNWAVQGLAPGAYNVTRMDFSMDLGSDNPASYLQDIVYKQVTLEQDEIRRVDLAASQGGTRLEGKVSSALGPEANAMIWALREDGPGGLRFGTTDNDGEYSIEGLAEGHYLLQVLPSTSVVAGAGSQPMAPVSKDVTIGPGPVQHLDVHVAGGTLTGEVIEKGNGRPIGGVRVILERTDAGGARSIFVQATGGRVAEAWSDEAGRFVFGHLEDGVYDVVAGGVNLLGLGEKGWSITRVEGVAVAEGRDGFTVEVELEPGGGIQGVVTDSRGKPLPNIPIWARDDRTGRWTALISETVTSASGSYEVSSLEPGSWTLAFGGTTHALTLSAQVEVRRDKFTKLDVTLLEGVEVWLDTSPRRVSEASIMAVASWGAVPVELSSLESLMGGMRTGHSKRLGRFPAGTYDVAISFGGEVVLNEVVHLGSGEERHTIRIEETP